MTGREAIETFEQVARPIMLGCGLSRRSCITAARVTALTLEHFGVNCVTVPVSFSLEVPARRYAYIAGFSDAERARIKERAATFVQLGSDVPTWNGHVVVLAGDCLVDASFDQAASPEHGVSIDPCVLVMPMPADEARGVRRGRMVVEGQLRLDDDAAARLRYDPLDDARWKDSDAWHDEGAAIVAALIVKAIKAHRKGGE